MDNRDIGLSTKTAGPAPSRAALFKAFAHRRYAQSDYLLSDMAADAVALLDHLGVPAAHVVGVSMGGMIAQQLTIDHPERVLSLCSIMSNTGNRRHGTRLAAAVAHHGDVADDPAARGPRRGRAARRWPGSGSSRGPTSTPTRSVAWCARPISARRQPPGHDPAAARHPGQPGPHAGPRRGAGAHPRHPRAARPAGAAERGHRHRPGGTGRAAADVPRHGARPPGPAARRDRRGGRAQRRPRARATGRAGRRVAGRARVHRHAPSSTPTCSTPTARAGRGRRRRRRRAGRSRPP